MATKKQKSLHKSLHDSFIRQLERRGQIQEAAAQRRGQAAIIARVQAYLRGEIPASHLPAYAGVWAPKVGV